MKKIYLLLITSIISAGSFAQFIGIFNTPGTSPSSVIGQLNYHVSESIYTEEEVGAANFISAATSIQRINFFPNTLGNPPSVASNFKVYLKNVPLATTTLATGTYSTAGYTLVYNGPYSGAPLGIITGITLTAPFVRTAGTNLEMLIERVDNVIHAGYNFDCAAGHLLAGVDDPTALSSRRYNSAVVPSGTSSLVQTNFRPAIELVHALPIDASLALIDFPTISCYDAPQNIKVYIQNDGSTNIAPGAASTTLHVGGANSFSGSQANTGTIIPGGFEILTFPVNLNNPGDNLDTAWVTLASDGSHDFDTLATDNVTAPVLANYPLTEDAETTLPVFPYIQQIVLGQLWTLWTGNYTNTDQTQPLVPRAPGTSFFLFDSYSGASSLGFQSRLFSNCINIPSAASNPTMTFWMSHDNIFPTDLDSMYVSVSLNKGQTWTRVQGFQRPDAAAATPVWRMETINLSAYANQTIQIGFEGVSKYGNAFGLDDINIAISGTNATIDSLSFPEITCHSLPQSIAVRVRNVGTTAIAAGAASVTLSVSGANTFIGTLPVSTGLATGATAFVNFTGINLSNPGLSLNTAYITLPADVNHLNDTVVSLDFTAETITLSPTSSDQVSEDVETTLPLLPFAEIVTGDRQLWDIWTGNYTNTDQTLPLVPLSPGNNFFIFDSYSGTSSDGFESRLISNCITLPQSGGSTTVNSIVLSFAMSHDNTPALSTFPDSLYLSISTDKGITWSRAGGYARFDATAATPTWRIETVDLTAFAGLTIQLGFEGVSKYGNAFGLDNINILTSLPVSLLSFNAQKSGSVNNLTWSTTEEQNSSRFIIERSSNGVNFTDIGTVAAAGFSNATRNYRFTDNTPLKGINYYRLRVVDLNNTFKYSLVRNVRNVGISEVSFAPNPVRSFMKLKISTDKADKGMLVITDISGKQVYSQTVDVATGDNSVNVETANLAQGTYFILVQLSDERIVKKFSKL